MVPVLFNDILLLFFLTGIQPPTQETQVFQVMIHNRLLNHDTAALFWSFPDNPEDMNMTQKRRAGHSKSSLS